MVRGRRLHRQGIADVPCLGMTIDATLGMLAPSPLQSRIGLARAYILRGIWNAGAARLQNMLFFLPCISCQN